MDFEDSRGGPSTKDYEIAMSNIYSARDQELSKAREYVRNQIRPFVRECVWYGLGGDQDPNVRNFLRYVKDKVDSTKLNHSFVMEVLDDLLNKEDFAGRKEETTQLMQEILRIYQQEKRAFETEIQKYCNDVLQLIIKGKFVIPNKTNNCIMVNYSTKYIFACNPELIKSIANNYLQQFCPKNIHGLSVKTIDSSSWILELELKK